MSDLPKRYAYAVTQHLPQTQREEVARELEATIEDMASDRAKNGKPTTKDIETVLQELGDPAILAHKYTSNKRYLIGPHWYDAWFQLLKTLLSIVPPIVALVMLGVGIAQGEQQIMAVIIHALGTGFMVGVHIVFWVTLVFAFLERGTIKATDVIGPWTPDQLPEIPLNPNRQVSVSEAIVGAVCIGLGILWLIVAPALHTKNGEPLLNPDLWQGWIPALLVLASLAVLHKLVLAKVGNWTTPLTVANVLLALATIVFIWVLFTTQQVINIGYLEAWGLQASMSGIATGLKWAAAATIATTVGLYGWDVLDSIINNRRLRNKK